MLNVLLASLGFCERYQEIESKPFKFEKCVETLHKVAKYNPLSDELLVSSDDDEAPRTDRNRVTGVMGETLERPQGRKAAKADAAAQRKSKKKDEDETEAAAASRIADSFQGLTKSMVTGQEFDRMERAIKLLRQQGRNALAERKMDELSLRLEPGAEEDVVGENTTRTRESSTFVATPPAPKALTPPPGALPPTPPLISRRGWWELQPSGH
jgi:hypothetical protein